jgi:hypothetical protein
MKSFYDLDESARVALCEQVIAEKRTLSERWERLAVESTNGWSSRAGAAAELLVDCPEVADLGCGMMALEKLLPSNTRYIPVDVVKRDDRTIVVDFNKDPPPPTSARAAVCLGLLPYLHDVRRFMVSLKNQYSVVVVSYNPIEFSNSVTQRRSHGWVNDYSWIELESLFKAAGWNISTANNLDGQQVLWRLNS